MNSVDASHYEPAVERLVRAARDARWVEIESEAAHDALRDVANTLERAVEAAMDMDDDSTLAAVAEQVTRAYAAIHARGHRVEMKPVERAIEGVGGTVRLPGLVLAIVPDV